MKTKLVFLFLAIILTACTPVMTNVSTSIPPSLMPTITATIVVTTPTQAPKTFIPIITPNAIQVARWMEYEHALAIRLLFLHPPEEVLCEWEILGQSEKKVYVWAFCLGLPPVGMSDKYAPGASIPAVIVLDQNGSVQSVELPRDRSPSYAEGIRMIFPKDVQERIFNNLINVSVLADHAKLRRQVAGPPLIILSAMPTATPTPAPQSFIPFITPDAFQVEHWKEYQGALAKRFIPSDYVPFTLCEWDIIGRVNQEVYVWAVCSTGGYQSMGFAVVHLAANGTVQTVEAPYNGDGWAADVQRMFPSDVREKIASYDPNHYITQEMLNHIDWRRTHPDEPPLVVLSATPTP